MAILCYSVSLTDKSTNLIYYHRYIQKIISDEDISCKHTATKGPHCHLNVTARAGRVPFKEVFKGLKITWVMKGFSAFANQFNTVSN
jgi:hypothetical protein